MAQHCVSCGRVKRIPQGRRQCRHCTGEKEALEELKTNIRTSAAIICSDPLTGARRAGSSIGKYRKGRSLRAYSGGLPSLGKKR